MGHDIINREPKEVPDLSNKRIECQCPLDHIYTDKDMKRQHFNAEKKWNKLYLFC